MPSFGNFCNCHRKRLLVNSSRLFRHLAYINIPIIQTQAPSWCQHGWFLPLKHQGCTQHRLRQATMHSITPSKFHCLHSLHARPAELTTQQFCSFGGDFMAWAGLYCMLMGHENWNNPGMFTGATFPQVLLCLMHRCEQADRLVISEQMSAALGKGCLCISY